jgi:predicted amidophosphoribosyltransferase
MAKCRRCGEDTGYYNSICNTCLKKWTDMRQMIWEHCQRVYGKLTNDNHHLYIKELNRLEKIWRKNEEEFEEIILENKNRSFIL